LEKNKIICASWIGRFGNRCHSYLYGKHIEQKFNQKFYVGSIWDGSVLFKNPAPIVNKEFSKNNFIYAGGAWKGQDFQKNKKLIDQYNAKHNDTIEFIDPVLKSNYGTINSAYISLITDCNWFYEQVKLSDIRRYFDFSDELKQTDMYKELRDKQGTYDVAHFRRTDISNKNYKGGHSMVSRNSYIRAFEKFGQDQTKILWISDEHSVGWKWKKEIPNIGGRRIPWLPDFLKIVFARNIFRSNSSFSLFASWISNSQNIYAPWLHEYTPGKVNDFKFVEGNHPHWMSVKGVHASYQFAVKDDINNKDITKMSNIHNQNKKIVVSNTNENENKMNKDKIVMVHWNGRFGNRVFSYMFGKHYANKHNLDFYLPSAWEGNRLFVNSGVKTITNDKLRLQVNQSKKPMDSIEYRKTAVRDYNQRVNDNLIYFNPDTQSQSQQKNVFFDSLCIHSDANFREYNKEQILKWLEFSPEVKNLDIYKELEDKQGTYDIAHLRRDDISNANYNQRNQQAYSVINKQSYIKAFQKFGFCSSCVEWTTDDWTGKWGVGKPQIRGGWNYPVGSKVIPDIMFDWLPDFLRLYFARTIFRANSSFSWVAAFLSPTAKVYSPVLTERKTYRGETDEVMFDFVEGNEPHWMNLKGSHCESIEIH
tara:strand:+ start:1688 stop:3631 length:1944 start_codon:yes stop_codon:yes gene_type:complete